jgi:hypothetical protein
MTSMNSTRTPIAFICHVNDIKKAILKKLSTYGFVDNGPPAVRWVRTIQNSDATFITLEIVRYVTKSSIVATSP